MKALLIFCIASLCLFSCKNKQEQLKEKITPILKSAILANEESIYKIDSLKIYKIDTLTDSLYFDIREGNLLDKSHEYLDRTIAYDNKIKSLINDIRISQSDIQISNYYSSNALKQQATANYDASIQRAGELKELMHKYADSNEFVLREYHDIDTLFKQKKVNNKNFRGYLVSFKILGSNKNNLEIRKDSLTLIISPSLRIIPYHSI